MVQQIAVFIENKKGKVLELAEILEKNGIDLLKLSIADTKDYGILRCITRNNDKAVKVLKEAGFTVSTSDLIGVEVDDKPGGLAYILKCLNDADISIEYLYSFAHTANNNAIVLFQIEEKAKALEVLKAGGAKMISNLVY